jgi:hypothetical protein
MYHIGTLQNKLGSEGGGLNGIIKMEENGENNTLIQDGEDVNNYIPPPPNVNNSKFSSNLD